MREDLKHLEIISMKIKILLKNNKFRNNKMKFLYKIGKVLIN